MNLQNLHVKAPRGKGDTDTVCGASLAVQLEQMGPGALGKFYRERACHLNLQVPNSTRRAAQYFKVSILGPDLVQELSDIQSVLL